MVPGAFCHCTFETTYLSGGLEQQPQPLRHSVFSIAADFQFPSFRLFAEPLAQGHHVILDCASTPIQLVMTACC